MNKKEKEAKILGIKTQLKDHNFNGALAYIEDLERQIREVKSYLNEQDWVWEGNNEKNIPSH